MLPSKCPDLSELKFNALAIRSTAIGPFDMRFSKNGNGKSIKAALPVSEILSPKIIRFVKLLDCANAGMTNRLFMNKRRPIDLLSKKDLRIIPITLSLDFLPLDFSPLDLASGHCKIGGWQMILFIKNHFTIKFSTAIEPLRSGVRY